jgi:hypothetical protein
MEGFMSIPVNLGKALMTIPAQLISAGIAGLKQQTSLETEKQNLKKARADSKTPPAPNKEAQH